MPQITSRITEPSEAQYDLADAIELVLETTLPGTDWSPSEIQRKLPAAARAETWEIREVLDWMERKVFVTSNERGGCWRRYGRRH